MADIVLALVLACSAAVLIWPQVVHLDFFLGACIGLSVGAALGKAIWKGADRG